jgi:hypothetical protein
MKNQLVLALLASLTLGLAPFVPHPHIWKQIRNLWFGRSMEGMDWLDLAMHGAPWLFLIYVLVRLLLRRKVQ